MFDAFFVITVAPLVSLVVSSTVLCVWFLLPMWGKFRIIILMPCRAGRAKRLGLANLSLLWLFFFSLVLPIFLRRRRVGLVASGTSTVDLSCAGLHASACRLCGVGAFFVPVCARVTHCEMQESQAVTATSIVI